MLCMHCHMYLKKSIKDMLLLKTIISVFFIVIISLLFLGYATTQLINTFLYILYNNNKLLY